MPSKKVKIWKAWLPRWLARTRLRERQIFLILTIAIGLVAGLSAVLFTLAIHGIQLLLFGHSPSTARLMLVPTLASLVAGVLLARYFQDARGSGVPQTKAAYHLSKGVIRARTPVGKFLTGALCIGAGHSLGREGPSVHIGAGLASLMGRWFRLSPASVRNLVPVGAAAALSAAFNTPIAAVLFALEEIVGDLNHAVIGSTVLASVSAVVLERAILGNQPLFVVPPYALVHPGELLAYAVLGIVGGIVSVIFCKGLLRARILFRSLPNWSVYLQPAMGGLLIGLLLVVVPEVMGVGYESVERALHGQLLLKTLLLLGAMKVIATIISYASGNAGGIFAPALFIGAMVGGATGLLMRMQDLFPVSDAGAYALVGMGTLFAGIIRAPMTSVFMIFELTQDYQIVVPLMIANMTSFAISRRFQRAPVYQALLQQDHIHLPAPDRRAALHGWQVRDIMNRQMKTLPIESTVSGALERARQWGGQCFPVLDGDALAGLVTTEMLEKALGDGDPERRLDALPLWNDPAVHIHPDNALEDALELLSQTPGVLPVTSRSVARRLLGVITLDSILKGMHASRRF
ncbi:MAG: chloride channel protein [Acidobacteriota bacterium]